MADYFSNYGVSTLASGIAIGATSLVVQTGDGAKFPSSVPFMVCLGNVASSSGSELVKCTAIASDTLTIIRAQEGTSAQAWGSGSAVTQVQTAANMSNLWTAINASAQLLPLDVVGSAGSGDVFAGTTLDGGWSNLQSSQPNLTKDRTAANWLVLKNTGNTSGVDIGIKRSFSPGGDFSVWTKVGFVTMTQNFQWCGIFVGDSTASDSGNRLQLLLLWNGGPVIKFAKELVGVETSLFSVTPSDTSWADGVRVIPSTLSHLMPVWLRIRRSGSTLYAGVSYDGVEFIENSTTTTISFTVGACGLIVGENTATVNIRSSFNYIATT